MFHRVLLIVGLAMFGLSPISAMEQLGADKDQMVNKWVQLEEEKCLLILNLLENSNGYLYINEQSNFNNEFDTIKALQLEIDEVSSLFSITNSQTDQEYRYKALIQIGAIISNAIKNTVDSMDSLKRYIQQTQDTVAKFEREKNREEANKYIGIADERRKVLYMIEDLSERKEQIVTEIGIDEGGDIPYAYNFITIDYVEALLESFQQQLECQDLKKKRQRKLEEEQENFLRKEILKKKSYQYRYAY